MGDAKATTSAGPGSRLVSLRSTPSTTLKSALCRGEAVEQLVGHRCIPGNVIAATAAIIAGLKRPGVFVSVGAIVATLLVESRVLEQQLRRMFDYISPLVLVVLGKKFRRCS